MATKATAPGSTGFEDKPIEPKKKRYGPVLEAIHKVDRLMGKLTAQEQARVYLHLRDQFQPELSFLVPVPKQGA